MEANMLLQSRAIFSSNHLKASRPKLEYATPAFAALTGPADTTSIQTTKPTSPYKDNLFDRIAISHLSRAVQATTGLANTKKGYESLVEVATMVSVKFDVMQQRQLVTQSLERAFPRPILSLMRALLPQSQFTREFFAAFTTVFFAWLVGPCEVKESETVTGRREKNVVYIRKCRFLEESNCVGMCINLCKMPSQAFIKDSLGMPISMIPNFDDMSCEMIYGMEPPSLADDPAFKQPCYKLCKTKRRHSQICSS